MTGGTRYRGNSIANGMSSEARDRLHKRLDELIDLNNEIAECINGSEMSVELADRLQHHAERLVIEASRFAGKVAGGEARAIAFRHSEPTSRQAFSRFLSAVAEYAAPYAYATLNLGIETFTWTDSLAVLDGLKSLDHGDVSDPFKPAARRYPRGSRYAVLREQFRAVQWVNYLTGQMLKEAAIKEVAVAYDVSDRTVYGWHEATEQIELGYQRDHALCEARREGQSGSRPNFTRSPWRPECDEPFSKWLAFDANFYKSLKNTTS